MIACRYRKSIIASRRVANPACGTTTLVRTELAPHPASCGRAALRVAKDGVRELIGELWEQQRRRPPASRRGVEDDRQGVPCPVPFASELGPQCHGRGGAQQGGPRALSRVQRSGPAG